MEWVTRFVRPGGSENTEGKLSKTWVSWDYWEEVSEMG